ncbi:MAG: dienelactone hydrolase family protein, partial [Myxococcales bacterium]|nr:dienelactone hydrolase family protein [Myxococcales bacterium]
APEADAEAATAAPEADAEAATAAPEGDAGAAAAAPVEDMGTLVAKDIEYKAGDTTLKGYIVWDGASTDKRPGILVVHEWWGLNDYAKMRARMLARLGYTAMALDMYGDGKSTEDPKVAGEWAGGVYADPAAMKARFDAALDMLKAEDTVDPERIGAMGYCFGGGIVLGMARAGEDLDGVVSFHGVLETKEPVGKDVVKPELLVLTGGADPMVPQEQVDAFKKEMTDAGAKFDVVVYDGAKHAFTNPAATEAGKKYDLPVAYDEAADKDSWEKMTAFWARVLAAK